MPWPNERSGSMLITKSRGGSPFGVAGYFPNLLPSGYRRPLNFLQICSIKAFDCRGHVAKLCIVFLPLLVATLVAISRVDDYRHHWEDVFAGGLLGITVATFCYLQFFPPPCHVEGWGPYAYFRVLVESRAATQAANNANLECVQSTEAHVENQQNERNSKAFMGMTLAGDSSLTAVDLESGGR
ncbi:Phosphoric monoester hydrolase [Sarracenia purpurea var. burkii]